MCHFLGTLCSLSLGCMYDMRKGEEWREKGGGLGSRS